MKGRKEGAMSPAARVMAEAFPGARVTEGREKTLAGCKAGGVRPAAAPAGTSAGG